MQINLTFNKPAAVSFFDAETKGVKVKIQDGKLLLKGVKRESGYDTFPVQSRTRGGVGVTVTGKFANAFLNEVGLNRGTHMTLDKTSYGWMVAHPWNGPTEKPSKVVPTARLWRAKEELGAKSVDAPEKAVRTPRAQRPVSQPQASAPTTKIVSKRGRPVGSRNAKPTTAKVGRPRKNAQAQATA